MDRMAIVFLYVSTIFAQPSGVDIPEHKGANGDIERRSVCGCVDMGTSFKVYPCEEGYEYIFDESGFVVGMVKND